MNLASLVLKEATDPDRRTGSLALLRDALPPWGLIRSRVDAGAAAAEGLTDGVCLAYAFPLENQLTTLKEGHDGRRQVVLSKIAQSRCEGRSCENVA